MGLCKSLRELRVVREGDEPLRLPDELWDLPALEKLDLGGNKLASLPAGVGRLSSLKELSLFDCDVTDLPASLGEIPSLQVVNVVKNPRLEKLPPSIAQNKALTIYR